jgi:hypothetical protein
VELSDFVPGRLSVTVLNYNYGRYLPGCLDAILAQTYQKVEVIVIDDCSTDGSLSVLEPYRSDPRVKVVTHEQNAGFRASLIEGTEVHSTGEFLTVISADDLVRRPDAFALQLAPLLQHPEAVLSFSSVDRFWSDTGAVENLQRSYLGDRLLSPQQAFRAFAADRGVWVMHSGAILRRSAYDACGRYSRSLKYCLDVAMWVTIAQEGSVAYVDQVLYGYRMHRDQMSRSLAAAREGPKELFDLMDLACDRAEARGWQLGTLREESYRARPIIIVIEDAHNGRTRCALEGAWSCLRGRPRSLFADRELWSCVLRAAVGPRAFSLLRSGAGPFRRRRPTT